MTRLDRTLSREQGMHVTRKLGLTTCEGICVLKLKAELHTTVDIDRLV